MVDEACDITVAADVADGIAGGIINIKVIQSIAGLLIIDQDIAFKIHFADRIVLIVYNRAVLQDAPHKAVIKIKSNPVAEHGAQRQTGIGINIAVRLLISNQLIFVIDNAAVQNRTADDFAAEIHRRCIDCGSTDQRFIGIAQAAEFIQTAEVCMLKRHNPAIGGCKTGYPSRGVNHRQRMNQISQRTTAVTDDIIIGQNTADVCAAIVLNITAGSEHTANLAVVINHDTVIVQTADDQIIIVNNQTVFNDLSDFGAGQIIHPAQNIRIAQEAAAEIYCHPAAVCTANPRRIVYRICPVGLNYGIVGQNFGNGAERGIHNQIFCRKVTQKTAVCRNRKQSGNIFGNQLVLRIEHISGAGQRTKLAAAGIDGAAVQTQQSHGRTIGTVQMRKLQAAAAQAAFRIKDIAEGRNRQPAAAVFQTGGDAGKTEKSVIRSKSSLILQNGADDAAGKVIGIITDHVAD